MNKLFLFLITLILVLLTCSTGYAGAGDPPGEIGDIVYYDAWYLLEWHRPGHTSIFVGKYFDGYNKVVIHSDFENYDPKYPAGGLGVSYTTRAIYAEYLTSFSSYVGYGSKTTTQPPDPVKRIEIVSYVMAKHDLPISYYDGNALNPKGLYNAPSSSDLFDNNLESEQDYINLFSYDEYNEFNCVGFAERAYENTDLNPTSSTDEEFPFWVEEQWESSNMQWAEAYPPKVTSRSYSTTRNTNIEITLSADNYNGEDTFDGELSITGSSSGPHPYSLSFDSNQYKLTITTPTTDFDYSETVTVTLTTGIEDLAGNSLDGDGDGVEGPDYSFSFTIQDEPTLPPTSITVNANSSDTSIEPAQAITLSGTANYNNGVPVDGTATFFVGATHYTAPVVNGSFSRTVSGPITSGNIIVSVTDGTLTKNVTISISVSSAGTTSSYDLETHLVYDYTDEGNGYVSYWSKDVFRTTDEKVDLLAWIDNANLSSNLDFRWKYYMPDGSQYGETIDWPNAFDKNSEWGWASKGYLIDGNLMATKPGKYKVRFYIDGDRKASHSFVVGWDFVAHNMAKGYDSDWLPVNITNVFSPEDESAVAVNQFEDVAQGIDVKTEYFSPDGSLYSSNEYSFVDDLGPHEWYDWRRHASSMWIAGYSPERMCGAWSVKFYIKNPVNGNWELSYTDHFRIEEKTPPSIVFTTHSPLTPIESQSVSLNLNVTDNNDLQKVILHWNDGTDRQQEWNNINSGSFSQILSLGSDIPGNQQIVYWAEAWDESDNHVVGMTRTFTINLETVSTPSRPSGPAYVLPGESASFTSGGSTTNLASAVEYQFDWGDGSQSIWGSATQSHIWQTKGSYLIKVRARSQVTPERTSSWSNDFTVGVNTPPIAHDTQAFVLPGTEENITVSGSDVDNDTLTYEIVSSPSQGSLAGTLPAVTYTPNQSALGQDTFSFRVNDGLQYSNTAMVTIMIGERVDQPDFTPAGGTYNTMQSVIISSTTPEATIRYTTDGSTPTSSYGTVYTSPVEIISTTTLKAVAYKSEMGDSLVESAVYTMNIPQVATPFFSHETDTFQSVQTITIDTATPEAEIRYTTDNSTPTSSHGFIYNSPIVVSKDTILKAIGYKTGMLDSEITSAEFFIHILPGDVDANGVVDLADTILSMQVMTNYPLASSPLYTDSDVDGDGKIGVSEIMYSLRYVAGLQEDSGGFTFNEDFSSGLESLSSNWVSYGSPVPTVRDTVYGFNNVFDNMGDPSYASGAYSKIAMNLSNGGTIEADIYLDFSDLAGCWASASLELSKDNDPVTSSTVAPARSLLWSIGAIGDACWATDAQYRRHSWFSFQVLTESGTWDGTTSYTLSADNYVNGWHKAKIHIRNDHRVEFIIDDTLLWTSTEPIALEYLTGKRLALGNRSSGSAGKAYHDNISVKESTPNVYEENFETDPGFTSLSPEHAYWDESNGTYYVNTRDDLNNQYWAYSPQFEEIDTSKPASIELDVMFEYQDWGTYPGLRFYAQPPVEIEAGDNPSTLRIYNSYSDSSYKKIAINDAQGGNGITTPTISDNTWYHIFIQINGDQTADIKVTNKVDGVTIYEITNTPFSPDNFKYFGVGFYDTPNYGDSWAPIRIDNVLISR